MKKPRLRQQRLNTVRNFILRHGAIVRVVLVPICMGVTALFWICLDYERMMILARRIQSDFEGFCILFVIFGIFAAIHGFISIISPDYELCGNQSTELKNIENKFINIILASIIPIFIICNLTIYMSTHFTDVASPERTELVVRNIENNRNDDELNMCAKHIIIFDDQMISFSVKQYEECLEKIKNRRITGELIKRMQEISI